MKSLRARSTCASRLCIRSNERASRPSSSGVSSPIGWSNSPGAIRLGGATRAVPSRREIATAAVQPTRSATASASTVAIRNWRSTSAAASLTSVTRCDRSTTRVGAAASGTPRRMPPPGVRPRDDPRRALGRAARSGSWARAGRGVEVVAGTSLPLARRVYALGCAVRDPARSWQQRPAGCGTPVRERRQSPGTSAAGARAIACSRVSRSEIRFWRRLGTTYRNTTPMADATTPSSTTISRTRSERSGLTRLSPSRKR